MLVKLPLDRLVVIETDRISYVEDIQTTRIAIIVIVDGQCMEFTGEEYDIVSKWFKMWSDGATLLEISDAFDYYEIFCRKE